MIDERARRRADGLFEAEVTLADGQAWWLPKPRLRYAGARGDGYEPILSFPGHDGNTYYRLVKAYDDASADGVLDDDSVTGTPEKDAAWRAYVGSTLALAHALLLRNYDLSRDELDELCQFSFTADRDADPEGHDVLESVMRVAMGTGPKAPAASSDAP